jgi:hypothetical protein
LLARIARSWTLRDFGDLQHVGEWLDPVPVLERHHAGRQAVGDRGRIDDRQLDRTARKLRAASDQRIAG